MNKINCKQGLNPKEEIEARRLKDKIVEEDKDVVVSRLLKLYKNYGKSISGSFYLDYIKEKDIILYSAFERAGGIIQMYHFAEECEIFLKIK